jgi:hypothetical protein
MDYVAACLVELLAFSAAKRIDEAVAARKRVKSAWFCGKLLAKFCQIATCKNSTKHPKAHRRYRPSRTALLAMFCVKHWRM